MKLPALAILPLFGYSTLGDESFVTRLLERPMSAVAADLPGFVLATLGAGGATVILPRDGSTASGSLFRELTLEDYERLDAYQGVNEGIFERTYAEVTVHDGTRLQASIYVPTRRLSLPLRKPRPI